MSQMVEDVLYRQMDRCGEFMKGVTVLRYESRYFLAVSLCR
jgi:hypothetical protein